VEQDNGKGRFEVADADDLPTDMKKSFDAMIEAEAAFKADLEKLLKKEGHMPEDKHLLMSRKGKRLGVAYVSTPRGEKRPWVQATRNSASCETMFARCKVAISSKEGHYMGSRRYSRRLGMCEQSGGSW
jgi:hypothetical protein